MITTSCLLALLIGSQAAQVGQQPSVQDTGLTLAAAVTRTLDLDSDIARARWALQESRGAVLRARGAFDLTFQSSAVRQGDASRDVAGVAENVIQYTLQLGQRLRGGIVVTPNVSLQQTQFATGDLSSPSSTAVMELGVHVPLLRGRGGGLVTAAEDAADVSHRASESAFQHQRALSALAVIRAYWNYTAATRRVEVLRDAESRAQRLLSETQKLIAADKRPAADEIRVRANHTSKRASRASAEAGLADARAALASAMGVAPEMALDLATATTPLPDFTDKSSLPAVEDAVRYALTRRMDLAAAHAIAEASSVLLAGARTESRPRFDLQLGVDYRGVAGGSALDALYAAQGLRTTVGFSFGVPLQNRDAAGLELQQQARLRGAEVENGELRRQISIDATAATARLHAAAAQLKLAHEAALLYGQDVTSEVARFRMGVSTLFDLFFAEDALTSAALAELDAQLNYAIALARIRFETATLFTESDETAPVHVDGLLFWSPFPPGGGS